MKSAAKQGFRLCPRMRRGVCGLLWGIASACGNKDVDGGDAPGRGGGGGGGADPGPSISGVAIDVHVTEAGEVSVPFAGEVAVNVFFQDGLLERRGLVRSDGTFIVPGVVESPPYYITKVPRVPTGTWDYMAAVTDQRNLLVGAVHGYRPDVLRAANATVLMVRMTGLDPWQADDRLAYCGPSADAWAMWSPRSVIGVGASSGTVGHNRDQDGEGAGLVSSSRGDRAFLLQYHQRSGETRPLFEAVRGADVGALEEAPGLTSNASVALGSGLPETFAYTYQVDPYVALAAQMHPKAKLAKLSLSVGAAPAIGEDRALDSPICDLAWVDDPGILEPSGGQVSFAYDNPYPDSWPHLGRATAHYTVEEPLGDGSTALIELTLASTLWLGPERQGDAAPILGPPSSIKVDGQSAARGLGQVRIGPTVSWAPPELGTAQSYAVDVLLLQPTFDPEPGAPTYEGQLAARVLTAATEVQLPSYVFLEAQYVIVVRALSAPLAILSGGVARYPLATAEAATGVITVVQTP